MLFRSYKMDIALGAHGMEGRAPFLDPKLVAWAQSLPDRHLVRGRNKKVLLRATYRDKLPPGALDRPKLGFGGPIDAWLAGPLREHLQELLPGHTQVAGQALWSRLVFAQWVRTWRATW